MNTTQTLHPIRSQSKYKLNRIAWHFYVLLRMGSTHNARIFSSQFECVPVFSFGFFLSSSWMRYSVCIEMDRVALTQTFKHTHTWISATDSTTLQFQEKERNEEKAPNFISAHIFIVRSHSNSLFGIHNDDSIICYFEFYVKFDKNLPTLPQKKKNMKERFKYILIVVLKTSSSSSLSSYKMSKHFTNHILNSSKANK